MVGCLFHLESTSIGVGGPPSVVFHGEWVGPKKCLYVREDSEWIVLFFSLSLIHTNKSHIKPNYIVIYCTLI